MNIRVARKLNERRYRSSPIVTTGELLNLIGSEGMQEAMQNRWLVADMDTGFLTLNTGGGKLQELENACRCVCGKTDCSCVATVESPQTNTIPMREAFAGFGLSRPGGSGGGATSAPAPMMPRPQAAQTPTTPADPNQKAPQIGDGVMVADEDKTYTGKVATIGQDGRIRISFGANKPAMNRDYGSNEIRIIDQAAVPAHA